MALDSSSNVNAGESDTEEKNLDQFEECSLPENEKCKYRDTNGRCIFETCIMDNEYPPQTLLWFFECIACKEIDSIKPAQVLPFTCIICGSSQGHRGKGFGNQICDKCISRLSKYINKWHCEHC